jgi:beta-glucanase (GH16 family)
MIRPFSLLEALRSTCLLAAALTPIAAAHGVSAEDIETPGDGYALVWNDEFDGSELDRGAWCTRLAYSGGAPLQIADSECTGPSGGAGTRDFLTDEQQRYRDTNEDGAPLHVVESGVLQLRATKTRDDDYAAYEAGMIRSKFEFKPTGSETYYIAARVRLPSVRGSFPAIWLSSGFGTNGKLSWPPEIDILEAALNEKDDKVNMVRVGTHVEGDQTDSGEQEVTDVGPNFDKKWSNFKSSSSLRDVWIDVGTEWTADHVCVYFNKELAECENYRWVDKDGKSVNGAQVILNLAVGGAWAARYGIDDSKAMYTDVDYVRVFKK